MDQGGSEMNELQRLDQTYIAGTYKRFPLSLTHGRGSLVWDEDGREYIDLGTGIAVNSFGYADEIWSEAVAEQARKLQHTSNLYYTEPCVRLAETLCRRTGMKKVFFSNSGAESNECAIKVARKYASEHYGPERCVILTLKNSFHGRTLTTLSATGQEHYHALFQPLTPGFAHVSASDISELREQLTALPVAALLIECVQGEGGVVPLEPAWAREAEALCREKGALLMVDEVQTGNGRSGALYAYMNLGLHPDVVSTAKGLAGGLPLGATLLGERVQDVLSYGDHGSTFGGNPVCCAAACSVLSRIDDALLADVRAKGDWIRQALQGQKGILGVTGMGLMLGVETVRPSGEVVAECMQRGVLCLTAKDRVRLLPALNIPMDLLRQAVDVLKEVCRS